MSHLIAALSHGTQDVVDYLLDRMKTEKVNHTFLHGCTCLMEAARAGILMLSGALFSSSMLVCMRRLLEAHQALVAVADFLLQRLGMQSGQEGLQWLRSVCSLPLSNTGWSIL